MRAIALACVTALIVGILTYFLVWRATPAAPTVASVTPARQASPAADTQQFLEALDRDDLEAAKAMLERWPQLATTSDYPQGETALHHAASVPMAQLLIQHGADPAARDRATNGKPARWAASQWRTDVRKFLETKAPPDDDITYLVATGQRDRLAAELVKAPEQMDARTDGGDVLGGGRHLLHIAATYGQPEVAQLLLESGGDACVEGGWNNTQPLENAAWAGYPEVVKVLIKHGADLEDTDQQNNHTALWYAAVTGRTEVVRILLDAGARIEDGMVSAVEEAKANPYPGRELPEKSQYDAVIALLRERGGKD